MVGATQVLAPVFLQVMLTFGLLIWAGYLRAGDVRSGRVQPGEIVLGQPNWPEKTTQVINAARNQFELPILFYIVSMLALFTARASGTLLVLAWLFVLSRYLHALIHVTTNNLSRRFTLFTAGAVILILMWLVYAYALFFAGTPPLPELDVDALGFLQTVR